MKNYQPYKELKSSARNALTGNYLNAILVLINVKILSIIPVSLALLLISGNGIISITLFEIISFILTIFLQLFQVGICLFYLKINCGQHASLTDIFYGFSSNSNTGLKISLLFTSISYVCMLPHTILEYYNSFTQEVIDFKILYLVLLIGNIITQLFTIPFSQCYYLLLDFPNRTAKEIIRYSFSIMKHNFGRYLLFILSFIPLVLLSFLSFGIGLLWVLPYMQSSLASFYLDIIKKYKSQS